MPRSDTTLVAKLTEKSIAKVIREHMPQEGDAIVWDEEKSGFGVRLFAKSGKASYIVRHALGRATLGSANVDGGKSVADAREEAGRYIEKAKNGIDLAAEKRKAAVAAENATTVGKLIETYLVYRDPAGAKNGAKALKPRYFAEIARQLTGDWKPLHGHAVEAVKRSDVAGVLDAIEPRQGLVAADRARSALSGLYSWAIDRGYLPDSFANPTLGIKPRAGNGARERVLTEPELREVWIASDPAVAGDHGRIVRLLILTGQRREEIGSLSWAEIVENGDGTRIELPGERTKNGRPHVVPLSDEAIASLPARPNEVREFVFGRRGTGFSGWSKAKAELDARIAKARKASNPKAMKPMPAWVLHDLRRSFVTHISERQFAQPHVVEAIVNHISGSKAGVAGVYNRAAYAAEKQAALAAWARHVAKIVG
jgi:integrase